MKKIFRKNQIIITALALMIAVAGYISYTRANVAENDAIQTAGETNDISDGEQIGEIFTDTEDNTQAASAADAQAEERSGQDTENSGAGSEASVIWIIESMASCFCASAMDVLLMISISVSLFLERTCSRFNFTSLSLIHI